MNDLPQMPTPQQASYQQHQQQYNNRKQAQQSNSSSSKVNYKPPQQSRNTSSHSNASYQSPQYYQQPPPNDYYRQQQPPQNTGFPPQQMYQQPPVYQMPPPPQPQPQVQPQVQPQSQQQYTQQYGSPQPIYSNHTQPVHPQQYQQQQQQAPPPPQLQSQHSYHSQQAPIPTPQQQYQSPRNQYESVHGSSSGSVGKKPPPVTSSPPRQQRPVNKSKESLNEKPLSSKQKLEIELRSVFEKVDVNKSGRISGKELSYALLNFDHTRFQDSTIKLMMSLFTNQGDGSSSSSSYSSNKSLNFDQFVSLWKYLSAYKKLFIQADADKSGDVSFGEFQKIIEQIGYKLDIDLVLHLFSKYSLKDSGEVGRLKFDSFIELLVYLRKLTDIFKKYDKDLSGTATIGFSDFLFEVSNMS
ncbi:hypothetical protein CANMA_004085 [Candida margitis]|uniref:uncharacterized protein n=1 Tax=Candida margitis TaxID=1775924 RepID=UPI00222662AC|nr:uncharacterized protein CANMA_004085 [Candida margitis]KAI5959649.1 hypothetical protein CANMA_004085 [Candida margitis]